MPEAARYKSTAPALCSTAFAAKAPPLPWVSTASARCFYRHRAVQATAVALCFPPPSVAKATPLPTAFAAADHGA